MKRPLLLLFMTILLLTAFTPLEAQVNLATLNSSYAENFNTLLSAGTTNDSTTLPNGWAFRETGTNANLTYAAGTGSSTTGNTYSLGLDADRSFGGLLSGSLSPFIGAKFINNTGSTITELQINYAGEQWRLGATPRAQADRLDFQYSLNATSLLAGTWTDHDALDFTAPILSGTVGALNGNLAANRTILTNTITGLSIPAGATFWIRWSDFNVASSDDALAIDDFTITPIGIPSNQPAIVLTPTALNFGEVNINTSSVLSYVVAGSNLADSLIFINTFSSAYTLSLDQINYNDTITISGSDTLYVKFSPVVNGLVSDSIYHYSSGVSKSLYLTGSGFDPLQNIVSIAAARSKSAGTKVTVAGRVTVANQHGSPSFIQDGSGGIPVFDFNFSNAIAIGDSVILTGNIGLFNNQVQIGSNVSFSLADSTKRLISPKRISIGDLAANEGLLVTVQQIELVNKAFVFYPQSTELITNGSVQADLRIDGDTNIPGLAKPQEIVDITGVVGRFRTNAQLLPRFREDVPGATEPQTPFDSIPKANTFDLMTWNLEFFGATREQYPEEYGPADEPLQLQNVQHIINSIHADVIAVQEVSDDALFTELIHLLPGYKGICSDRYSYSFQGPSNFPPQKVCFIYDSAAVQVESTRVLFENLYDSARLFDASLIPNYPTGDASSFWSSGRLPFMLTAYVTVDGVTEKIHFINLHAKSGSTQSDYNRRAYDAGVLKDSLDAQYANDQIVILGDYNDDLTESIVSGLPTSYSNFVQDTAAYNSITRSLSLAGAKSTISFDNVIDNQIISTELNEEYLIGSEQIITPFAEVTNYANTTSDHLPVVSRFEFIPASARFATNASTVTEGSDSVQVQLQLSKPLATDKVFALLIQSGSQTAYGADYITSPATSDDYLYITIPADSTTASVWISTIDDTQDEHDEYVSLQILPTAGIVLDDSLTALFTLTILDNDATTVEFIERAASREEGSGQYAVRLKLSTAQATDHTVTIKANNGQGVYYGSIFDYTTTPALSLQGKLTLTIPAGYDEVEFKVVPNKDLINENDEVINFSITAVSAGITKGVVSTSAFTIVNTPACLPVFTVFPNPTFGNVNIYTLPGNEDQIIHGTLIDPRGDVIASSQGTTAQLSDLFTTALQGKKRGVYVLKLTACDTVVTIRILKL